MFQKAARDLISDGYALVTATEQMQKSYNLVFKEGRRFFSLPSEHKIQFELPSLLEGYWRPFSEFSQTSNRPDLCESFSAWMRNSHKYETQNLRLRSNLHSHMSEALSGYAEFANAIFECLRMNINPTAEILTAGETSYLQMNHYRPSDYDRDLLQDPHEDGHLITILRPTAPGAEIKIGEEFVRVELKPDQVLLMPGSLMTAMTAGAIQPLIHRVRNDRSTSERMSLMFFVNPSIKRETIPWVDAGNSVFTNVRRMTIDNSSNFGLPSIDNNN